MSFRWIPLFASLALLLIGSPPASADQTLVPSGSAWKYLDNGSNPGTAWREPAFDDASWPQGNAQLGYGDGDEATVIGFGGDTANRHITTYFRRSFTVGDPSAFLSLKLRLLRDDGAVVYLNGTEIRRDNLPAGTIAPATLATTAVASAAESTFYDSSLSPSLLVAGTNTLAVEVHQSDAASSDVSFNLELIGETSQSLVPAGSAWKYLDNGSDPGTAWREPAFDDASWPQGNAQLGYGDGDEATVIGFGGDTANRHITSYFRKSFTVDDPSAFLSLKLRLLRDDGAVVYLNGTEIRRDNLPAGTITPATLATTAVASTAESTFYDSSLSPSLLVAGTNTLAVEVHQSDAASSDVSFNLELLGMTGVSVTRGPYLQLGTPTSIVVRWRTDVPVIGRVTYGTASGSLTAMATGSAATTDHEVTLTGLEPDTRYWYAVGTPEEIHRSGEEYSFRTAPTPGTVKPTRIWALGDSGTANSNARAVASAFAAFSADTPADVWLMLGDNAYNSGTDTEYQAAVFDMYPAFLRRHVLWSTIGNHDTGSTSNPALTIPYFRIFSLPANGEAGGVASGTEKYYSFDHANIHFICLDSMASSRSSTGAMATWLAADLQSTTQEWIIAFWHHPPYTKGSHDSDVETALKEMRANFLPQLEAGGVDLVLCGHSHSYERSHLLNGHYGLSTTLTPSMILDSGGGREQDTGAYRKPGHNAAHQGAVYITAGSSGKIAGGPLNHPAMFVSLNNLGSMVLDIHGPRLDARFLRENGSVADSFTLLKETPNQLPIVRLTAPTTGTVIATGTDVVVQAEATDPDPDGSVIQVDFYQGDTPLGSDTTDPFEFTWSGAAAGTYILTAAATDNLGATVASEPVTIIIEDPLPPPPAAPTLLTATAGPQAVSLSWQPSEGAHSYNTCRKDSPDGIFAPLASGLTTPSFLDSSVTNSTTYFYIVTATNAAGESTPSAEASATPLPPPTAPNAPAGLTATAVSPSQINLVWTDTSNNETGFRIERKLGTGQWSQIAVTAADVTGFSSTGLRANTTYSFRVRATNAVGNSPYSNEAKATTFPLPPAPPTGLVATAGNGRVTLTWTASSTAKAYHVFRSTVSGSGYSPLASGLTATSFIDTTVTGNTTYYYVVTAANSGGESAPSAEVSATPAPPLTAPAGLTATAASKSRIDLAWTDTSGTETGFRIERKLGTGKWSQIAVTAANVTRFSSTGLRANSTYSFRVRATNASGNSPYSNEARATTLRQ